MGRLDCIWNPVVMMFIINYPVLNIESVNYTLVVVVGNIQQIYITSKQYKILFNKRWIAEAGLIVL
jgi:hypothetical protein